MIKIKQQKIQDESGRSMVEMLGVLAIMGVLAIGGIAGYRWAMDKYNANEILNEVRKRAVTASQQRILGHAINLSEYGNNTIQGHMVTTADNYNGDTSFFALTVSGIEKDICEKVIKEKIPFTVEEKINDIVLDEEITCSEGNNDITFAFANTLDSGATVNVKDEQTPGDSRPNYLKYCCPQGTSCTTTCSTEEVCRWGTCEKPEEYGCTPNTPFKSKYSEFNQNLCLSCDDPYFETNDIYACRSICDGRDNTAYKKRYVYKESCVLDCPEGTIKNEELQLCQDQSQCPYSHPDFRTSALEDSCIACGRKFAPIYWYGSSGVCCPSSIANVEVGQYVDKEICMACGFIWEGELCKDK